MKLVLVTKFNKRNKTTSKKFGNDAMSTNCDVIVFFSKFMANLEQSGRRIVDA